MLKQCLAALIFLVSPLAHAQSCPWMPDHRIDELFPDRAPWSTMVGGEGRCKFVSDQSEASSTLSLTKMDQGSAQSAQAYVEKVAAGMAKSYSVKPAPALGKAGAAVRQDETPTSPMLTLIAHQDAFVVMTQLSFYGGVSPEQQATAETLTLETFTIDSGVLTMPSK